MGVVSYGNDGVTCHDASGGSSCTISAMYFGSNGSSVTAGQTWSVQMARQGTQFFSGRRTTNAAGDFTINTSAREVKNVDDVYTARARNLSTGEVCSARVVLPD